MYLHSGWTRCWIETWEVVFWILTILLITCYFKAPTEEIMKFLRTNQSIRFEQFELTFDLLLNLPCKITGNKSMKITNLLCKVFEPISLCSTLWFGVLTTLRRKFRSARFIRSNEPAPPSGYTRSLAKWVNMIMANDWKICWVVLVHLSW